MCSKFLSGSASSRVGISLSVFAGFKQFETKCLFSIRVANGFAFESRECGIPSGSPFPLYIVVACTVCVCVGLYVVVFISLFRLVWGILKTLLSISVANRFAFDVRESAVPSDSHIPLFIAVACMFGVM